MDLFVAVENLITFFRNYFFEPLCRRRWKSERKLRPSCLRRNPHISKLITKNTKCWNWRLNVTEQCNRMQLNVIEFLSYLISGAHNN